MLHKVSPDFTVYLAGASLRKDNVCAKLCDEMTKPAAQSKVIMVLCMIFPYLYYFDTAANLTKS